MICWPSWTTSPPQDNAAGSRTMERSIRCPFHDDRTPSASWNDETHLFYCFTCGWGGSAAQVARRLGDAETLNLLGTTEGAGGAPRTPPVPLPSNQQVIEWHRALLADQPKLDWLRGRRTWSEDVLREFAIGWDGERITIPITSENGALCNVRRYLPNAPKSKSKMLNWKGHGATTLWPMLGLWWVAGGKSPRILPPPTPDKIWVVEGEPDVLACWSHGQAAVTHTGGANRRTGRWPTKLSPYFTDMEVTVFADDDEVGRVQADRVKRELTPYTKRIEVKHV